MLIHCHLALIETMVLLRGKICWHFYDDAGNETESIMLVPTVMCVVLMLTKHVGTHWSVWRVAPF